MTTTNPMQKRNAAQIFAEQFPWKIFWIALAVRLAAMTLGHYYHVRPYDHHFNFGWEMGRIARSVATGQGYANPFDHVSGPTAWVAPLYPLLMAAAFRLFGVYTALSAWVILAVDCLLSALMIPNIWEIAGRCFNRKVAWWSAWIWALYPAAMQYAVKWFWEMTLTAFLFTWVLVLAMRMRNIGGDPAEDGQTATMRRWAMFGVLWGLIALSAPSLVIFLPFCGLWVLLGQPNIRRQMPRVVVAGLLSIACIAPWIARNALVFHKFVPMRTNFGAELDMGNDPQFHGMVIGSPAALPQEERLYDRVGELEFSKLHGIHAKKWIGAHPGEFLRLAALRFYFFWAGVPHAVDRGKAWTEIARGLNYDIGSLAGVLGLLLALRRKVRGAWLFAMGFVVIPFMFYFVFVDARLRHPLEPLIAILGVYLFQSAEKSWQVRWFRRKTAAS
jgi:hypothetical protein